MSRRREKRNRRAARPAFIPAATPTAADPYTRRTAPPSPPQRYRFRTRTPVLVPSVFDPPVRAPLIRTVRTDTTHRFAPPSRRRSPDLANRLERPPRPWQSFHEETPLPSLPAITCARRQIRKEVLLAMGRGNGAATRHVPKSKLRCS